jgi:hypothetical protein
MSPRRQGTGNPDRAFERAMAESADHLGPVLSTVRSPAPADPYFVFELGRLLEEGKGTFEDEEFRFLIQQGVRIEYDRDIELRARFVEKLRGLAESPNDLVAHVVGAIEDVDFPLNRIGAVVRHYSERLFTALAETDSRATTEKVTRCVDELFESPDVPEAARSAISRLEEVSRETPGSPDCGVAQRALAYAVSEPLLEESLEEQACSALRSAWPASRSFLLYNLRKHHHEDLPFRWLELLVTVSELRGVERILEEVLWHAPDRQYREDLLVALDLTSRSTDPGRVGKLLRLLSGPHSPGASRALLSDWANSSPEADFLQPHRHESLDFVHLNQDMSSFAASLPELNLSEIFRRWDSAYHESLGWQQAAAFPRSEYENVLEEEIRAAILDRVPTHRPDEATLRQLTESLREERLSVRRDGLIPLVEIHRLRPVHDPWVRDVCLREINHLYLRAAGAWDSGERAAALTWLELLEEVEPNYPLAASLRRVARNRYKT